MAALFFLLMAGMCICAINANEDLPMEIEEIKAIQDILARANMVEEVFKAYLNPESAREETCIPEGRECKFAKGPNCCGIDTRCIVFDTQIAQSGGPAKWISKCRVYKAGAVAASVVEFFENIGG